MIKRKLTLPRIVICFLVVCFLLLSTATLTSADDGVNEGLDCLSCHEQTLGLHDELGQDNDACYSCHDATDMSKLHLADGTPLSLDESNQLCGQCHQARYDAWQRGTHGFPGTIATGKCTSCHDPHQPEMAFLNITKPHPEPTPPPADPSFDLIMIVIISLVFMTGLSLIVMRQGKKS